MKRKEKVSTIPLNFEKFNYSIRSLLLVKIWLDVPIKKIINDIYIYYEIISY